jgi:hypothetical protein
MSFANLLNLRLAAGEAGERFAVLALLRRRLAMIADGVIAAIWLTGLLLVWWRYAGGIGTWSAAFAAKLAFVVALTASHALVRRTAGRMAATGDRSLLPRVQLLTAAVFVSAAMSILLAVAAFEA